jgi:hypothetical protein
MRSSWWLAVLNKVQEEFQKFKKGKHTGTVIIGGKYKHWQGKRQN